MRSSDQSTLDALDDLHRRQPPAPTAEPLLPRAPGVGRGPASWRRCWRRGGLELEPSPLVDRAALRRPDGLAPCPRPRTAIGRNRPRPPGPVPPAPTIPVGSAPAVEPESVAERQRRRRPGRRGRKPRTRSKPKDKEPPPVAPEPMLVNWVQVALASSSGSSLRQPRRSGAAPDDEAVRPTRRPTMGSTSAMSRSASIPMRPDEDQGSIPNEAPDPDDPGQRRLLRRSRIRVQGRRKDHQDEHPGYAESREPGGEDAAIHPDRAGRSQPGRTRASRQRKPLQRAPRPARRTKTEVAGIAADASAKPSERAPCQAGCSDSVAVAGRWLAGPVA